MNHNGSEQMATVTTISPLPDVIKSVVFKNDAPKLDQTQGNTQI